MAFRVLLPTAGTGSRLREKTRHLNKSLVSVANRPTICHSIEQFPNETEFVIALGHHGNLVREFLSLVYPSRRFIFVDVDPFEGIGSGLGLSVLMCQPHLQEPFVFASCDTLVTESVPPPDHNWMGYAELSDFGQYRTISITGKRVAAISEKGEAKSRDERPYIGLAGICDYEMFWRSMEADLHNSIRTGESFGMKGLLGAGVAPYKFTWFDTGNLESLEATRRAFQVDDHPNILEKPNEAIWFIGDQVVKFSSDETFIRNRTLRSETLRGFVPEITGAGRQMYKYQRVRGEVLSKVASIPVLRRLLEHSVHFWQKQCLSDREVIDFRNGCHAFYKDKTEERIADFYRRTGTRDREGRINGIRTPSLAVMLRDIDWIELSRGEPVRFHGDFHFENILYDRDSGTFVFLDWRQDFAGSLTTGDLYYDFAKLLHGLIISHELISRDHYQVQRIGDDVTYDFHRKQILIECEHFFVSWLREHNYDLTKVRTLTALVFLNIAALHHHPYDQLLYCLGKKLIFDQFEGRETDGSH